MKHCKNYQNVTQRNKVSKCCWKNGTNRFAGLIVATNLQFVKNSRSVKHNKAKQNKTRYACTKIWEGCIGSLGLADANYYIVECINNKVLLYSTGNYIQYPVINHNRKEYEKEYICITDSLCCAAEINTTL